MFIVSILCNIDDGEVLLKKLKKVEKSFLSSLSAKSWLRVH